MVSFIKDIKPKNICKTHPLLFTKMFLRFNEDINENNNK